MSERLTPREQQAVDILRRLAAGRTVVTIGHGIPDSVDAYPEAGMRARLTDAYYSAEFEGHMVTLDFAEFEEHNRPYEGRGWYDRDGKPTLTAREAGDYKPQESFYISLSAWRTYFTPLPTQAMAVLARYQEDVQGGSTKSYLEWLEEHAAQTMDLEPAGAAPAP